MIAEIQKGAAKMEKLKVLLADDDAGFRMPLAMQIKAWGYDLIEAENGKQALELAMTAKPDIILLDYMMPEMDGFVVLEQIRKTNTDVAVVMLTAYTEEKHIKTAAKLGIKAFVPKISGYADTHAYVKTVLETIARKLKAKVTAQ
jgi:CheY-like chemotaxis protein